MKQELIAEITKKLGSVDERRRSRTVLGGAEGEIPSVYSTVCVDRGGMAISCGCYGLIFTQGGWMGFV